MNDSLQADATLGALRSFTQALTLRASAPAVVAAESHGEAGSVDRLARIAAMEELRAVLAAAQAVEVAALTAQRRAEIEHEIATVERPGVGRARRREHAARRTVAEIARARRISPWQARRFVTFAEQAPTDLPLTFHLLATGRLSEHRAVLVHRAVTALDGDQRRSVDTSLAPDLPTLGDTEVDRRARRAVYETDPAGTVARHALALADRRVSVRPAPEGMGWVSLLCSMPDAVGIRAGLERDAAAVLAQGDPRGRGAIMADLVVERVTGRAQGQPQPVAVQLVMTDRALAAAADTPARFAEGEPWPAPLARAWTLGPEGSDPAAVSIRRLFTDPTGRLVTAETNGRAFTPGQADLLRLRDGICTTPWCNAPIRHLDHHDPAAHGGPTALSNGRGLCQWCNETKADTPPEPPPPCTPRRPRRSRLEHRTRRQLRRARRQADRRGRRPEHTARPRPRPDLVFTRLPESDVVGTASREERV